MDTEFTKGTLKYTQEFDYTPSRFGNPVPEGTIYDYEVDYFAIAPYVHTDWNMTDAMTLSGGLRYDSNKYDYKNQTTDGEYSSSGYLRPKDRNDKYDHLSPKLALSYQIDDSSMVYTRYANAFRVPSATRLYNLKTKNGDFSLDPETSNTYEVGYKLGTKATNLEVALFYMDINDTITRYRDSNNIEYYKNGGTTSHKGLELTYGQTITSEWSTKLAYSFTRHQFENDDTYGNDEMANAPNHIANLRVYYRPKAVKGLAVMAEGVYNSEYWMDNSHTEKYAGYTLYNLKADYQINPTWRAFAKVDNLTDERYAENARYSYGKEKYSPGAPRQIFIGAEASF